MFNQRFSARPKNKLHISAGENNHFAHLQLKIMRTLLQPQQRLLHDLRERWA